MDGVMKPNEIRKELLPVSCVGDVRKGITDGHWKGVRQFDSDH
jgi:hypothetical protein